MGSQIPKGRPLLPSSRFYTFPSLQLPAVYSHHAAHPVTQWKPSGGLFCHSVPPFLARTFG